MQNVETFSYLVEFTVMTTQFHIEQMSLAEKLRMMEALWEDLSSRAAEVPVPQWHKDVLDERERLLETGEAKFVEWETAKKRIIEEVS